MVDFIKFVFFCLNLKIWASVELKKEYFGIILFEIILVFFCVLLVLCEMLNI